MSDRNFGNFRIQGSSLMTSTSRPLMFSNRWKVSFKSPGPKDSGASRRCLHRMVKSLR